MSKPEGALGNKRAACTIISKNYLAFARAFTESYKQHNPGEEVYVLLVDRLDGFFDPAAERFKTIELAALGIEGINELSFKYNVMELNTAVKPFLLEHLFKAYGLEKVAYFDPDIMVLRPLDELWGLLDGSPMILTPHLDAPLPDQHHYPNDFDMLLTGSYNLGFIALRDAPDVRAMLAWWQEKLRSYSYADRYQGYFVDQKWMDLAPGMFGGVRVLRDPGYNTAYWNLHSRRFERDGDGYRVNGRPAYFFHFSGFSPEDIECISRHQNRLTLADRDDIRPLFEKYREALHKNGYAETMKWPYAFNAFDNGVVIPDVARKIYGYMPHESSAKFGDPFRTEGEGSYYSWLNQKDGVIRGEKGVAHLWHEVYKMRVEAQALYPHIYTGDWAVFMRWCASVAEVEGGIPEEFAPGGEDKTASEEIVSLRTMAVEKDRIVADKDRIIADKDCVIADKDRIITDKDRIITDKDRILVDKDRIIADKDCVARSLENTIRERDNTISTILNSYSWKITRPVRWISSRIKSIKR